ncbi:MAG: hypothetical protein ABH884_00535 [Candidatus Komeilibacteria bacterium]
MLKQHMIARQIAQKYISAKKPFSVAEVESEILNAGGFLRVSTGFTVRDYFEKLEFRGVIIYHSVESKYHVVDPPPKIDLAKYAQV